MSTWGTSAGLTQRAMDEQRQEQAAVWLSAGRGACMAQDMLSSPANIYIYIF